MSGYNPVGMIVMEFYVLIRLGDGLFRSAEKQNATGNHK